MISESWLTDFWWGRLPLGAARLSRRAAEVLLDGLYLTAWPRLGALLPPVLIGVGVLLGWLRPTNEPTFTYSLPLLIVIILIAGFGAACGAYLLAGYILGDFLLFSHSFTSVWGRPALLLSYLVLMLLTVVIPFVVRLYRQQTVVALGRRLPEVTWLPVVIGAGFSGALVYAWTQAAAVLIRPVFTWQGHNPTVPAIQPLQENGSVLVLVALVVGGARVWLEQHAEAEPVYVVRRSLLRTALRRTPSRPSLPTPFALGLQAGALTLLLSGLFTSWLHAILVFAVFVGTSLGTRELGRRVPRWAAIVTRVPRIARLAVGVLLSYVAAQEIVGSLWSSADSFLPVILGVLVSIAILSALLPERSGPPSASVRRP